MDRELAGAVLKRWNDGLPVAETALYKAASVLGIDPEAALLEARYYTNLDSFLSEKRAMSEAERIYFSAAAGFEHSRLEKTASTYHIDESELILEALAQRSWVPDLEKIANLGIQVPDNDQTTIAPNGDMDQMQDPSQSESGSPTPMDAGQMVAGAASPVPMQGAQVQQDPAARFKPSPTSPDQLPPDPNGNLDALLQENAGIFGQQAQDNGGLPPAGAQEPPPPPLPPDQRIQQVAPDIDPETAERYGDQLTRFEQGIGMQISDPKQMVKFVQALQKIDGKRIDQGIKAMSDQLEQEQAQELGLNQTPTVNPQSPQVMAPKKKPHPSQSQPSQAAQQGDGSDGSSTSDDMSGSVQKVAHAARILARSHFAR